MSQEIDPVPRYPRRPEFQAQTELGLHVITLSGTSLKSTRRADFNFHHASLVVEKFIGNVTRSQFARRNQRGRKQTTKKYVLWVNDLPYYVLRENVVIENIIFSDGSIKIKTTLALLVALQGVNISYDAISKYPSFKQGLSELLQDIERAGKLAMKTHNDFIAANHKRFPEKQPHGLTIEIDLFRKDEDEIENALKLIAIEKEK